MRWQPADPVCAQCGFDWSLRQRDAVALINEAPAALTRTFGERRGKTRPTSETWAPATYLWHLVDVLRIGTERLWTLQLDPAAGLPCWDENALARVRQYDRLSTVVGLTALGRAAAEWSAVALLASPAARSEHAQLGELAAIDVIRRNAHEIAHHQRDIERGLATTDD